MTIEERLVEAIEEEMAGCLAVVNAFLKTPEGQLAYSELVERNRGREAEFVARLEERKRNKDEFSRIADAYERGETPEMSGSGEGLKTCKMP